MLARIWKDPVWASVSATGVTALASYFGGWWPAIAQAFKDVWSFLTSASPISHWGIGLLAFMALPTLVVGIIFVWQSVRPAPASTPDWYGYTEDTFFGLRWRWSYSPSGQIQRLTTFCPHCDYQVFSQDASAYAAVDRIAFHCDSCHSKLGGFTESFHSLESKTERFIQQKIRKSPARVVAP